MALQSAVLGVGAYLVIEQQATAGIIIAVGDTSLDIGDSFSLAGIAFGTIVVILAYHMVALLMPASMKDEQFGTATFAQSHGNQNLENLGLADDYERVVLGPPV